MTTITYKNLDGSAPSITWGGVKFQAGKAVDVKENPAAAALLAKARNNKFFEVSGEDEDAKAAGDFDIVDPVSGQPILQLKRRDAAPSVPSASIPAPPAGGGSAGPISAQKARARAAVEAAGLSLDELDDLAGHVTDKDIEDMEGDEEAAKTAAEEASKAKAEAAKAAAEGSPDDEPRRPTAAQRAAARRK